MKKSRKHVGRHRLQICPRPVDGRTAIDHGHLKTLDAGDHHELVLLENGAVGGHRAPILILDPDQRVGLRSFDHQAFPADDSTAERVEDVEQEREPENPLQEVENGASIE